MSSITHTQTIDCQHNNKFFFHVYPPSQMFLLSIWTTILSVYIEIIHHLEGSGVFFSSSFSQNKMALFLSWIFSLDKKMTLIQYIYIYIRTKQTYTQKTMIYTYDNKKKEITSEITRGKRKANTE